MLRNILLIAALSLFSPANAQISMPKYTVTQDSTTHITVVHIDNSELRRIKTDSDTTALIAIMPDIKIKNGVVDHKAITGEMYVREIYVDSTMLGYIEYDGTNMKRELYLNSAGDIFLEKRYQNNNVVYLNDKVQIIKRKHNGTNSK